MFDEEKEDATSERLTLPLKWHGGKYYLAKRIISLTPPHIHYVEPFFGGGSVLLMRDPDDASLWLAPHKGVSEVVNDKNSLLTNFWKVLQDPEKFAIFQRKVEAIPMSRIEWEQAKIHTYGYDVVNDAVAFFVWCRQSRAGMMKAFTSITRNRTRRQMNGNVSEWLSAVDGLLDVHKRLRRVLIENMDAVELIKREDGPGALFYCDPPYLHGTRVTTNAYAFEMSVAQHEKFLQTINECKGKVMVSGYASELYEFYLSEWTKHTFDLPNNAAGGDTKRRMEECLWVNY